MELEHISNDKEAAGRLKKGVLIAIAICFAIFGVVLSAFPKQSTLGSIIELFLVGAGIILSFLWCWLDSIINDYSILKNRLFFVVVFTLFIFILPLGLIIYIYGSRGFKKGNVALLKAIGFCLFLILVFTIAGFITCLVLGIPI
jgi:hypothetical protein